MRAKALPTFGPLLAALMLLAATGAARALDFPTRTIRVVVPFAAAGVTDIVARIVFDKVAQALGQQVIIDNRPGAGGTIAVDAVAHSPPDGYTLVMADPSGSLPANLTLYPKLPFHPLRDLAPLTFVSTGNGTPGHLNGELFMRLAGIKAVHIPYRVVSQGVTDLVTSRVSFWIAPIPTLLSQIQAGQVRPLAVAGDARSADLPGIPTVKESGVGDFDASTTYGLFAPAGTPGEIVERLHVEVKRALEIDSVQQKLRAAGVEPTIGTPDDVKRLLETKIPQWAEVIKSAGIKIDDH